MNNKEISLEEATEILTNHYQWRLGVCGIPETKPYELSQALYVAIRIMDKRVETHRIPADEDVLGTLIHHSKWRTGAYDVPYVGSQALSYALRYAIRVMNKQIKKEGGSQNEK